MADCITYGASTSHQPLAAAGGNEDPQDHCVDRNDHGKGAAGADVGEETGQVLGESQAAGALGLGEDGGH